MSIPYLTTSGLLTEQENQKSNPSMNCKQPASHDRATQPPLRASVPRPRQSGWTNRQQLRHPDTASDACPEEKQVNPLKGAHKGYFKTLFMNSCLEWTSGSLLLELQGCQIRGRRGSQKARHSLGKTGIIRCRSPTTGGLDSAPAKCATGAGISLGVKLWICLDQAKIFLLLFLVLREGWWIIRNVLCGPD